MRLRTRTEAVAPTEALAQTLAEVEVRHERDLAALEASMSTLDERLGVLDGGEAVGEITSEDAAKGRGDALAEHDALEDAAKRSGRAVENVLERLIEAAETEAAALKVEPLAAFRAAEAARDEAAAVLAERDENVAAARANVDAAEAAGKTLLVKYDPAARERDREENARRKTAVEWAVRQVGFAGLAQLPPAYQAEARAAIEARNAEAQEHTRATEAAREFPRLEVRQAEPSEWPRAG